MTINSFEILLYLLTLLLPGYIIRSVIVFLTPRRQKELQHLAIFRLLMYGGVNLVFAMILLGERVSSALEGVGFSEANFASSVRYVLGPDVFWVWVFIVFCSPVGLSVLWALVLRSELHRKAAHRLGFRPELDDPSAWDYRLSRIEQPTYVIVTLADDIVIYGVFGSGSYASSVAEERDLYLQQVLAEGFQPVEPISGMWISASDIKRVEIFWQEDELTEGGYTWGGWLGRLKGWLGFMDRQRGLEGIELGDAEVEDERE